MIKLEIMLKMEIREFFTNYTTDWMNSKVKCGKCVFPGNGNLIKIKLKK